MKITLDRMNDAVLFKALNEEGNSIMMDGSEKIGGTGTAARPMEVLLMALGGCSSIDIISILKKMKQPVTNYHVEIDGKRAEDQEPAIFTDIHISYFVEGDVNPERVNRAAELSVEKYCSVSKMIEHISKITYSVYVNGEKTFG